MKLLVSFVFLISLFGCGVMPPKTFYIHPLQDKPNSEVSTLGEFSLAGFHIIKIDGEYIRPGRIMGGVSKGVILRPGTYNLLMGYASSDGKYKRQATGTIEVKLEPGHTYIPSGRFVSAGEVYFKLKDKGTDYPIDCLVHSFHHNRPEGCDE